MVEVPNADLHAQAIATPKGRAELAAQRRKEVQAAQERAASGTQDNGRNVGGQYLTGSALERYKAAKDAERSVAQTQGASSVRHRHPARPSTMLPHDATRNQGDLVGPSGCDPQEVP